MNWNEILAEQPHWMQAILEGTSCYVTTDGVAAVLSTPSDQARQYIEQLYILTKLYPCIRKRVPSMKHLYVISGSVYDLVRTNQASIISIS